VSEPSGIDKQRLAETIAGLPESEKLVASLLWYEGMTLEEIAQALGTSAEQTAACTRAPSPKSRRLLASRARRRALPSGSRFGRSS
jgi:hypothetical protein